MHGNGIRDEDGNLMGFPWDWEKKSHKSWDGLGMGIMEMIFIPITMDKWKENRAVLPKLYLSLRASSAWSLLVSAFSARLADCWNKKDGYRQQNVRQRQKLISIRGLSSSLKLMSFKSLGAVSYSPSIVTMAISAAILEIFNVKEWPDLEIWVWGPSRSLKKARFDRQCMTFY